MKKFFQEFGAFISRGNALDLAVGLVIGTAFNAIIKSLVNDIIMPLISLIGGKDVSNWFAVLRGTATYDGLTGAWVFSADAVVLRYGAFIQAVIDFLIIAFAIFLALKVIMGLRKKLDEVKAKLLHKESEPEKK
jgi:large conductance mechanosensitive channel